jgi:hypothetical protein
MTQTISVSKVNTAMTYNGTTNYTLFTLASGTASRIIPNALSLYRDDGSTGYAYAMISIYNATTGNIPIGFWNGIGQSCDAIVWFPGNMAGISATGPYGSGSLYPNSVAYYSANSAASPAGDRNAGSVQTQTSNSSNYGLYIPSQFWMCNGDQLRIKASWSGATGACQASFTIITES